VNELYELQKAIGFIEGKLLDEIKIDDVARHVHLSKFHLQKRFSMATGYGIGEYIRNRRLSLAARDIMTTDVKIIDVALKYMYETPESFTKAFTRLYRFAPSQIRTDGFIPETFHPISINVQLTGGFKMNKIQELKEILTPQYADYLQEFHDYAVNKGLTLVYRLQDPPNPPRNNYLYHYNEYFHGERFIFASRVFTNKKEPNKGQLAAGVPLGYELEQFMEEVGKEPNGSEMLKFCRETMSVCDKACLVDHGFECPEQGRTAVVDGEEFYVCVYNAYVGKLYHTPRPTYTDGEVAMIKRFIDIKMMLCIEPE
jgi:AraC-like DNA-binding protein